MDELKLNFRKLRLTGWGKIAYKRRMSFLRSIIMASTILGLGSGCTAVSNFVDNFDNQPDLTSPCASAGDNHPCGPKHYPDRQWLMNHHGFNIPT